MELAGHLAIPTAQHIARCSSKATQTQLDCQIPSINCPLGLSSIAAAASTLFGLLVAQSSKGTETESLKPPSGQPEQQMSRSTFNQVASDCIRR